jgi:hypothetical protein
VDESPHWNTNVLWGILAVFLVVGTLGGALFVFALTVWLLAGALVLGAVFAAIGATVAFLAFLFMAGILYRVDRYRGVNGRVVKFFE